MDELKNKLAEKICIEESKYNKIGSLQCDMEMFKNEQKELKDEVMILNSIVESLKSEKVKRLGYGDAEIQCETKQRKQSSYTSKEPDNTEEKEEFYQRKRQN